jgi:hypothetical protein
MLRKAGPLVLAAGLAFLAAAPVEWFEHGPTLCLFKRFLGIECLGCGMTRALSRLLHGELAAALAHNRLVAVVLPLLVALLVRDIVHEPGGSSCKC